MRYVSTRGKGGNPRFLEAVAEGLAPDGGLFVPESMPDISKLYPTWENLSYPELCFEFLRLFADDMPEADLKKLVAASYKNFDDAQIAPLRKLSDKLYMLELFHGPTLAFKDFALQFLGNLNEYILSKTSRVMNVLGATSGDTGSAAINGMLGKRGVNIFILYPEGRISPLQERQMACTGADNVFPIAIRGTFDDAQAIVKELFGDLEFKAKWNLGAVNSINLARILAQCVYYVYASLRLPKSERENATYIVPTGNFGNVLAGWLAWKSGMPAGGFKVATNQNDILFRLFSTGVYKIGKVEPSYAPSMDIQVASNFERFIYFLLDRNSDSVRNVMETFKKTGSWKFENFKAENFTSSRMDDARIADTIAKVRRDYGVTIDPHTACAFADSSGDSSKVVLATAHPAKFPELIEKATGVKPVSPALEALLSRKIEKTVMDADAQSVRSFIESRGIK